MTISKLSELTGLSIHTLRYYEKIGLILNVDRDAKGHRDYSDKDVIWIEFIKRLKATDMPLSEMKRFAELRTLGDATIGERVKMLEIHKARVKDQMKALLMHQDKIQEKIEICKKGGLDTICGNRFSKIMS